MVENLRKSVTFIHKFKWVRYVHGFPTWFWSENWFKSGEFPTIILLDNARTHEAATIINTQNDCSAILKPGRNVCRARANDR